MRVCRLNTKIKAITKRPQHAVENVRSESRVPMERMMISLIVESYFRFQQNPEISETVASVSEYLVESEDVIQPVLEYLVQNSILRKYGNDNGEVFYAYCKPTQLNLAIGAEIPTTDEAHID